MVNHDVLFQQIQSDLHQGHFEEAESKCLKLLQQDRTHLRAVLALAEAEFHQARFEEAIQLLKTALQMNPNIPEAHVFIGESYRYLDQAKNALPYYEAALKLNPAAYWTHVDKGLAYQQMGYYEKALLLFEDCFHARRGVPINSVNVSEVPPFRIDPKLEKGLRKASTYKLTHDIEQFEYLLTKELLPFSFKEEVDTYRSLLEELKKDPSPGIYRALTEEQYQRIAKTYNRAVYVRSAPALKGPAINPDLDSKVLQELYFNNKPGMVFIDDLLTLEALTQLRAFCLESTVWYGFQAGTYLGAYVADGFASGLLYQIAEELRQKIPGIIQGHRLRQAWAYKYDHDLSGIALHADEAAVNVNFWLTPDEANLDPKEGGLLVYKKEAPLEWSFRKFNSNQEAIQSFLKETNAKSENVPYRQNRAVIFNSDLFHRTSTIHFKPGYENRRINITLLYGIRQARAR